MKADLMAATRLVCCPVMAIIAAAEPFVAPIASRASAVVPPTCSCREVDTAGHAGVGVVAGSAATPRDARDPDAALERVRDHSFWSRRTCAPVTERWGGADAEVG